MNIIKRTVWTAAGLLGLVAIFALPAAADQVIFDDCIIVGSQCIGQDCVNGESFGFDTLRLKENNVRMHFDDTSTSASFPKNDWRLVANDSSNGGASYLAIEDTTAGRVPFRVVAGAPANSLYINSSGRIGLKTASPVVELHIADGDSPTLRLEQNGSSGFTPQTWDVAGNEANFFVRDVTNGSKLPFKIKPGAPTSTVFLAADGNVGLSTEAPAFDLHVKHTEANAARIKIENTTSSPAGFVIENTLQEWRVSSDGNGALVFRAQDLGTNVATLDDDTGNLTITGGLITGTAGSCNLGTPCDGVFRPEEYTVESIKEHASYMWENEHLRAVGPTRRGEPINLTQKTTGMLNELEKAHIYIEQLHDRLAALEAKMAADEAAKTVE